ncbi:phosphonoacetaldehyde hydrolase [Companilactobacillus mishanensis]|uniref:phosphonoacetaldehyde hydrolase n=1 Tax=Companilactobacillus mishanensis TaxID=2486008 RepID=UPI0012966395|nr:phosphonoacetaldehyde hydrolase [Companilactobacillus mishanensis]MQS89388.1 phosphonoacetaldehyde hydrolase [Companilactobacillus mishanensis]
MIEAVIFDWAGTTVDYGSLAPVAAFRAAFNEKGISPTDEEIRQFMGMSKWDHIGELLSLTTIKDQWMDKYGELPTLDDRKSLFSTFEAKLMAQLVESTELKPGLLSVISYLNNAGIKIGTTTGYTAEMMAAVQRGAAALGYAPETVVTAEDVDGHGRPAPNMILSILSEFGVVDPDNAVKIGDTLVDIEEGQNAGVKTIGIVEGSSLMGLTEAEFENLSIDEREAAREAVRASFNSVNADYIINNLSELPEALDRLNQLKEI